MKKAFIILSIPLFFILSGCGGSQNGEYVTLDGFAQGTTYHIVYKAAGDSAEIIKKEIEAGVPVWFEKINKSVSGYDSCSIISRINRNEPAILDSIFLDVFRFSKDFYRLSNGAMDAASAPLFDIWGFGFTTDSLPSPEKVAKVRAECGMDRLKPRMKPGPDGMVHPEDLLLESPGADAALPQLNYNAVAQGYSCDLVAAYLESAGIYDMLVNIGGEIFCQGVNPGGGPWTVGVDKPVDGNDIPGAELQGIMEAGPEACGVVTSGNYRKFYVKDGRKYAHTVDPRTGCPVTHSLLSATIIAPDAAEADALATYCMVVGLEKAVEYIESRADIEGYLIYEKDGSMCTWSSSGFPLRES